MTSLLQRFDALTLRERALIAGAFVVVVLMAWYSAVFEPMTNRASALSAEVDSLQQAVNAAAETIRSNGDNDAVRLSLERARTLQASLRQVNLQLESAQAGLIAPERMKEVIHDVLSRQRGLKLVSLKNEPVRSLLESSQPASKSNESGADQASAAATASATTSGQGPFVHPVELVVEGSYLDVLAYLRALESLPWHFYWKALEIETLKYPTNRVRIELSTLSLDKQWLGV
jgi:MSHA biogenesis protein MshJ